ncbi:MAG TPA: secretin N-terminal domain-containing protein [Burkholderiales bacterium]|nr:secretin N-terminal domain-containing protein [Burkholderiales bacterium]
MKTLLRWVVAMFASAWLAAAGAQQTVLEVIDLKYRSADQIVPVLKPLLAPGGTISSIQNQVILRTTPQNLSELRKVLAAVDTRPRRLLISVRQEAVETGLDSHAEVSGSVGTSGARVNVPGTRNGQGANAEIRSGDNVVRGRVLSTQSSSNDRGVQTVQVMEGNEALIRAGQSIPIRNQSLTITPIGSQVTDNVQYRDADSGFRVRPRVTGDNVTLEISSRRDSVADPNTQSFNIQRLDTVVTARLGEWVEIGGVDQSRVQNDGNTISRRTGSVSDDRKIFLKVDELK